MGTVISEIRNGFNNAVRRIGNDALDRINPPAGIKYAGSLAVEALTTPIHLGRNASDKNSQGGRDWDVKSVVVGTKSAEASNGSAYAVGDAKAGDNSYAVSLKGKAQTGDKGTSISLSAKGTNSNGKVGKAYSSTVEDRSFSKTPTKALAVA